MLKQQVGLCRGRPHALAVSATRSPRWGKANHFLVTRGLDHEIDARTDSRN